MADNMAASNVKIGGNSARAYFSIETKVKVETNRHTEILLKFNMQQSSGIDTQIK